MGIKYIWVGNSKLYSSDYRILCDNFPKGVARAINQTSFKMKHVSEIKMLYINICFT